MLILVLNRSTYLENIALIERTRPVVDGYELRIDFLKNISITEISKIRDTARLPIIFTWKNPLEDEAIIYDLAKLGPDFFDLDYTTPISVIKEIAALSPLSLIHI